MRMVDLIEKKRDGGVLTDDEIRFIIKGFTDGSIPDYQMSAFAMTVFYKGMTDHETAVLTDAMMRSGDTVDLSRFGDKSVDKHSTGGVGDKTTLIVAPITSRPRKHGCQVTQYPVPPTTFLRDGSIVLLEQITTIDKRQCRQYLGSFDARQMDAIRRCIEISIGQDVPGKSKRIKTEQEAAAGANELCKKRSSR